jgi:4-hydroxy-tetrahydrodipicolinate synthase
MNGVCLPIITPFEKGKLDLESYEKLIRHYVAQGISALVPLGTTGEAPTVEEQEYLEIVKSTVAIVSSKVPILVGICCNSTHKAEILIRSLDRYPIDGYLVTSPYYNLPSQAGIYEHFAALSRVTDKKLFIYNIPYRTGRNIENETILQISKLPHIAGIKDSCGNISQSLELLRLRPNGFSVFTGEDILFYVNVACGGDGGVLASAHLNTSRFLKVFELATRNDHKGALAEWMTFSEHIPLLFKEPNPGPIKYILFRKGLIKSDELRLPLAPISNELKQKLDGLLATGAI